MFGFSSFGVDPLAQGYGPGVPSAFQSLITSRNGAGAYLVEIDAYAGGDVRLGGVGLIGGGVLGETSLGDTAPDDGTDTASGLLTLRWSDTGWCGTPTDADRANILYEPRISSALSVERRIGIAPEQSPRIARQIGAITFNNADGAFDNATTAWAVDGRAARVYFGPVAGSFDDFGLIAELLGTGWEIGLTRAELTVRDRRYSLDTPLQSTLYAGTGDAEGGTDLEGKPRPLCYGKARNIPPVLVDATNLIYEFHSRQAQEIDAVYDQGLALTDSTTRVASFSALQGQAVSAGQFAGALTTDGSYIKLGSSPAGLITADVRGDATGGYVDTIDAICIRMLETEGALDPTVINSGSWAGLVATGGTMGIYLDQLEVPTTGEVIDALVQSVGGFWGAGRDGRIRAGRLTAPEDRAPIFFFQEYDILELRPDRTPIPRYRQRVGYQRRFVTQVEDIAGAVTDARKGFLAEPYSVVSAADTSIRVRHLEALDPPPLVSYYDGESDAQTLANDLLALHKVDRQQVEIRVKRFGYLFDLGQVVSVTHGRLGLSGGKRFVITGIREEAERDEQIISLWG